MKADALKAIERAITTASGMTDSLDKSLIVVALNHALNDTANIAELKRPRKAKAAKVRKEPTS